jgi:hypothetical protein
MDRLRIDWKSLTAVAPQAAATGDDEAKTPASSMRTERPLMVYVMSTDATDSATRKLEDVVFANEQVAVGAKFFDAVKISEADAAQDRILAEAGDGAPRIIFLGRDYKVDAVLEGKAASAGRLKAAMGALVAREYENSFDKMVGEYIKLLNELDRLDGRKAAIADQQARLKEKPNASKAKKVEREGKELEADMAKWQTAEKELLSFRPKGEKAEPQTES